MMGGFGIGGMFFAAILMILFWVLVIGAVIWLVVTLVRGSQDSIPTHTATQAPLDILKMRYARGEITKEQFDQMKQDLSL